MTDGLVESNFNEIGWMLAIRISIANQSSLIAQIICRNVGIDFHSNWSEAQEVAFAEGAREFIAKLDWIIMFAQSNNIDPQHLMRVAKEQPKVARPIIEAIHLLGISIDNDFRSAWPNLLSVVRHCKQDFPGFGCEPVADTIRAIHDYRREVIFAKHGIWNQFNQFSKGAWSDTSMSAQGLHAIARYYAQQGMRFINGQDDMDALWPEFCNIYNTTIATRLSKRILSPVQTEALPLPVEWVGMREGEMGLIMPGIDDLVGFNETMLGGYPINVYCCPDYSRIQMPDGRFAYTFEQVNGGLGLTAEKVIPMIVDLIIRQRQNLIEGHSNEPLRINMAIADFEATEANSAQTTTSGTVAEFKQRLGESVAMWKTELETRLAESMGDVEFGTRINPKDHGIDQTTIYVDSTTQESIAQITLGAITDSYAHVSDYNGFDDFQNLVESERTNLLGRLARAQTHEPKLISKLDKLIKVRLNLLIQWADPTELSPGLITLKEMHTDLTEADYQSIDCRKYNLDAALLDSIENIIVNYPDASRQEKEQVINSMIVDHLFQLNDDINYLRGRVMKQAAEYVVLTKLMIANSDGRTPAQVIGDSAGAWQLAAFLADEKPSQLLVKGGYAGDEKID